jgi:primosomal protein N' (replication factor Y) (superfamily II helicase)
MTGAAPHGGISRVALDVPLSRLFDYRVPEGTAAPAPGTRVRVPFGRQRLIGVVIEQAQSSLLPEERLKPITAVLDTVPVLGAEVLELVRWASDYYHHPLGEVIAAALPKAVRGGASLLELEERWAVTPAGREVLGASRLARSPAQRQLLELLRARGPLRQAGLSELLAERLPRWRAAATALLKQGWVQLEAVAA